MSEETWRFPKERLIGKRLVLCRRKVGIFKKLRFSRARLELGEVMLPSLNHNFKEDRPVDVDIMLDLNFPFGELSALQGKSFKRSDLGMDDDPADESFYLYAEHNQADTLHVAFGSMQDGVMRANVKVRLDLSSVGQEVFEHVFEVPVETEDRG